MLDSDDSRALSKISLHYPRALHLLRERISLGDETKTMSDSTIMVVLVLALHARVTGDHIAAKQHMEGALKITNLRGGLGGEDVRPMLAMEIFRYVSSRPMLRLLGADVCAEVTSCWQWKPAQGLCSSLTSVSMKLSFHSQTSSRISIQGEIKGWEVDFIPKISLTTSTTICSRSGE